MENKVKTKIIHTGKLEPISEKVLMFCCQIQLFNDRYSS